MVTDAPRPQRRGAEEDGPGAPALLGLSVVDNVAPTLAWLQKRMNLGDAGLRKVVVAYPTLLGLRIERMEANCAWLEKRLGLDEKQLARVVAASPPLFI